MLEISIFFIPFLEFLFRN